jgi:hypothetical protein
MGRKKCFAEEQQLVLKKGSVINGVEVPPWTTPSPGFEAAGTGSSFRYAAPVRAYLQLSSPARPESPNPTRLLRGADMFFSAFFVDLATPMGCSSCRLNRKRRRLFGAGQARRWRVPRYFLRISARRTSRSASWPIALFAHPSSCVCCTAVYITRRSAKPTPGPFILWQSDI